MKNKFSIPELEQYKTFWVTREAHLKVENESKKTKELKKQGKLERHKSMAQVVDDLIMNNL